MSRRRRRHASRRRDATLGTDGAGAVRRAKSCSRRRRNCFLHIRRRLPLAPVLVYSSPHLDIRRPLGVRHPLGLLLLCPARLLRRRREGVATVVASWEDKFSGRHRGGAVEAAAAICLAAGSGGKWRKNGWEANGSGREKEGKGVTLVADPLFTLRRRPRLAPVWTGHGLGAPDASTERKLILVAKCASR
jgi:hypothetical protein